MKKFSFKKLITVSLFFTSVIFTSAFTTCFIPIVSTSHSNEQPNATKIDLNDYNNKTLPKPFEKPDSPINQEQLITQLEEAEGNQSLPWVNWKCYPNQFEDFVPTLSVTGGSFTLMAKPNAVNYVGSSTAKISFNYTDSSKTDISTIITNIQLTTDTNAFSVTPSSQQLLTQLKQVNQNVRINSLTVDPSTAVWDKTHVIVGDETHSGSYKVTVSVKPNDLIYTGTVDVYYLIKRSQLNFTQTSFILPSVSSSRVVNEIQRIDVLIIILDNNEIDVDSILQNYSFTWSDNTGEYVLNINANSNYLDITQIFSITINPDMTDYFTLTYDELNDQSQYGWSGWTAGSLRFYEIDQIHHRVYLIDDLTAASTTLVNPSINGINAIIGDQVMDLNTNLLYTVSGFVTSMRNIENGPFGSYASGSGLSGSLTLGKHIRSIPRNGLRGKVNLNDVIAPINSELIYVGNCSTMNSSLTSFVFPSSVKVFGAGIIGSSSTSFSPLLSLTFNQDFMVNFYPNDGTSVFGIFYSIGKSVFGDGSGEGRIYVKSEALRQQYINDPGWSTNLIPATDSSLEEMIQVL